MELTVLTDEEAFLADSEITSFTLDSPAGPQKYSKFDSSPEAGGHDDQTPEHSPMEYSDVEVDVEPEFDPSTATYETLTEEQKALLSPDTKKRLEDEWQARLVAQLPISYASYMGCRNVIEFDCVNRVEEGTFGVVYRAKNKRTGEQKTLMRQLLSGLKHLQDNWILHRDLKASYLLFSLKGILMGSHMITASEDLMFFSEVPLEVTLNWLTHEVWHYEV
ncbi:hypothetical protein KIN20_019964 [Parelaphostrongylus tenuis]|uniref:Protein kinase domain-containing protein n=1 Tax=Parelaphostrongylus tenuis TaxID=148309 RepID=A0AAD5MLS6_PARTN|nr:hypothetical protein KIN20_019964 [Parelaphostrongylus tenuis]